MKSIQVKINGKTVELKTSKTIQDMIVEKKVTGAMFVVEKNGKIIQKEDYSTTLIENNDVIEIVGFFGGG